MSRAAIVEKALADLLYWCDCNVPYFGIDAETGLAEARAASAALRLPRDHDHDHDHDLEHRVCRAEYLEDR